MTARKAYFWSAARQWGQRFGSALTFVVIARLIPPAELGLFSAALALIALAEVLNQNGVGEAVIRHQDASDGAIAALNLVNIGWSFLLALTLLFGAPQIEDFFAAPGLAPVVRALSLILLVNAFVYIPMALMRRNMEYQALAKITLSSTFVSCIVGLSGAALGFGVWALVAQALTYAGLNLVLFMILRGSPLRRRPRWAEAVPLLQFGGFVMIGTLSGYAGTRSIELSLPYHFGTAVLGLYIIGNRFYSVAEQMVTAVAMDVGLSRLSAVQDDLPAFERNLKGSVRTSGLMGGILFTGLAAVAEPFCILVFGPIGGQAYPFLVCGALAGNVYLLNANQEVALRALGYAGLATSGMVVRAAIALLVLIPAWGLTPLATVILVALLPGLTIPINAWLLHRKAGVGSGRVLLALADVWLAAGAGFAAALLVPYAGNLELAGAFFGVLAKGATFVVTMVAGFLVLQWVTPGRSLEDTLGEFLPGRFGRSRKNRIATKVHETMEINRGID